MKNLIEIKPCPFCGGQAELDTQRGFINYKRVPAESVAVYCSTCLADMCLCRDDFPGHTAEDLVSTVVGIWNSRTDPKPFTGDIAGHCQTCGGLVFHRNGKAGEYDHNCKV